MSYGIQKVSNIVSGCVGSDKANVHNVTEIGERMGTCCGLTTNWFLQAIPWKRNHTGEYKERGKGWRQNCLWHEEALWSYGRMLVINQKKKLSLETLFSYELALFPASLNVEYGYMKKEDKSTLVDKLGVTTTATQDVEVADGRMLLHHACQLAKEGNC